MPLGPLSGFDRRELVVAVCTGSTYRSRVRVRPRRAYLQESEMRPPPKFNDDIAAYTPDEHLRQMRGERIISTEYIAYRNDALLAAGLDDEVIAEVGAKTLAEFTPEDHLADLQQR